MADIFISYAREDQQLAETLSKALEAQGWSVWWDRWLAAGQTFGKVIEKNLRESRCVIVLWSKASVNSRWVLDEANEGLERGILVPLQIDGTRPPMGFRSIHATSIAGWKGAPSGSKFELVQYDVSRILGPAPVTQHKAEPVKENTYNIKGPSEEHFGWTVTWSKFSRSSVSWSVLGTLCVLVVAVFLLKEPLGFNIGPTDGTTDPPPDGMITPDPDSIEMPLPMVSFNASESSILYGESTTLNWSVSNVTEVHIDQGIGQVSANDSRSVSPTSTTTYTLTATGEGGATTERVEVTVKKVPVFDVPFTNSIGMEFVPIKADSFQMGSDSGEDDEKPVHVVRITKDFYMGVTEVTQGQWEQVMNKNPSKFKDGANHPVESVSWRRIQEFIEEMNQNDGEYLYRLPTEAEWEFACRAGSMTKYYYGDDASLLDQYAVYGDWFGGKHKPVKRKRPNDWGLHDMMGNVYEWTADWYEKDYYEEGYYGSSPPTDPTGPESGTDRVLRGGSYTYPDEFVTCSNRRRHHPRLFANDVGFRLVALPR